MGMVSMGAMVVFVELISVRVVVAEVIRVVSN